MTGWPDLLIGELKSVLVRYPNSKVILRMGINDLGNISAYIALYKDLMIQYPKASFYIESVTPVDETLGKQHGYSVTNKQIVQFNSPAEGCVSAELYQLL